MNLSKKQEYLIIAGLLVLIFPFFALLFFVHPQGDDFFFAAKVNEMGVWAFVKDMYFHWSGRYASMFIGAFDPLRFESLALFRFSLLFFQLFFIASIFTLFRSIIKEGISRTETTIYALSFYVVFINGIPDVLEFLYWFPGVSAYQFGLSLFIFFISNYVNYRKKTLVKTNYVIVNSLLILLIIGLVEVFILPLFIAIIIIYFINVRSNYNNKSTFGFLIVLSVASVIVMMAPGNFERLSVIPGDTSFLVGAYKAVQSFILLVGFFLQNATFVFVSILFMGLSSRIELNEDIANSFLIKTHPFLITVASIFFSILLFFPVTVAIQHIAPGRVFNFVSFFFALLWFFNILIWVYRYKSKVSFKISKVYSIVFLALAFMFLFSGVYITDKYKFSQGYNDAIYLNGNILGAYSNLLFTASNYDKEMKKRVELFSNAQKKELKTISVAPLIYKPKTLVFYDFNEIQKPGTWLSNWEVKYYNLDSIYIEPVQLSIP